MLPQLRPLPVVDRSGHFAGGSGQLTALRRERHLDYCAAHSIDAAPAEHLSSAFWQAKVKSVHGDFAGGLQGSLPESGPIS
ncbi:MAG: hypothetical protein U0263_17550 [Polyangiaceae bacterium]